MGTLLAPYSGGQIRLTTAGSKGDVDPVSGIGKAQLVIPVPGRYLVSGNIWLGKVAPGDALTKLRIEDIDGVVPVPARGMFPNYPVLISLLDLSFQSPNQVQYFLPDKPLELKSVQNPPFLTPGLYITAEATKAQPGVDQIYMNVIFLAEVP